MKDFLKALLSISVELSLLIFISYRIATYEPKYVSDLYTVLCSDGSKSYAALPKIYKAMEIDTKEFLESIRAIEIDKPSSPEQLACVKMMRNSYKAPYMTNALINAIGGGWYYGVPPQEIRRALKANREYFSRDLEVSYFLDQLLNRYSDW